MKKVISMLLCVVLLVSLTACTNNVVAQAEQQISDLGEITLQSGPQIESAEKLLELLRYEDRAQVSNLQILVDARETYDRLVVQNEVETIQKMIDNLGEITLENAGAVREAQEAYAAASQEAKSLITGADILTEAVEALGKLQAAEISTMIACIGYVRLESAGDIEAVRKAYDDLDTDAQGLVYNTEVLIQAEARLEQLREEEVLRQKKEQAQTVIQTINQIGYVTVDSGPKIEEAKRQLQALPEDIRALVTNSDKIVQAEQDLYDRKVQYVDNTLASMHKYENWVDNITVYYPQQVPFSGGKWIYDNRSFILPYLVIQGDQIQPCVLYNGYIETFVNTNSVTVAIDSYRKELKVNSKQLDREIGWNGVSENFVFRCDNTQLDILRRIADSEIAVIRLKGDDNYFDFEVPTTDKTAIRDFLKLLDIMKELNY